MITRHRRRTFLRRIWMPLLSAGVLAYFGYHAFSGSFGIWAMDRLEADRARLTTELETLKAEHAGLEKQVAALRPSSLDADVVDLDARDALNMMRPDELLIAPGAAQQLGQ